MCRTPCLSGKHLLRLRSFASRLVIVSPRAGTVAKAPSIPSFAITPPATQSRIFWRTSEARWQKAVP